ncbi:TAM domain methyltransferase [Blastomyces dermatitidis ER-3]|nr:TAM domain methyltransferase [Blastomyces dermatitidis ER-3]EEQ85946.1 TAM domain methyltransferase [Blastomyces dermatitidis ER-3]
MVEAGSYLKIKPSLEANMEVDIGNTETYLAENEPTSQNYVPEPEPQNGTTNAIAIGSDTGHSHSLSSSKSLSEHIIEDILENERRYCNETYFMPNDEAEQTRLSIEHQIFLIIYDGRLAKTKLPPTVSRILDVGTGTGDWALGMGEMYPDAEILAIDISVFDSDPISIAPPNVFFQIDDAECGEWNYHHPFDFIHIRGLSGAIADWPSLYSQAFKNLEPDGHIEVADVDYTSGLLNARNAPANSYLSIFLSAIRSAADVAGYPRDLSHLRMTALVAAGFEQVRTYDIRVPIGTWCNDDARGNTLGKMVLIVLLEGLEAASMRSLTKYVGWTPEQVRDLCDKVKMEIVMGAAEGAVGVVKVVTGRKPGIDSALD